MKLSKVLGCFALLVVVGLCVVASVSEVRAATKKYDVGKVDTDKVDDSDETKKAAIGPDGEPIEGASNVSAGVPHGATELPSTGDLKTTKVNDAANHEGGEIIIKLKNKTKEAASDLHFFVRSAEAEQPAALRIVKIGTSGSVDQPEEVGLPGNGNGAGIQIPSGIDGDITEAGGTLKVEIVIEYWDGDSWEPYADKKVKLRVWWTHGANRNVWIANALPNGLGDGDDRKLLASVLPGFADGPVVSETLPVEGEETLMNHIALGEVDGTRFKSGSVVISPALGTKFGFNDDEISIMAVDEEGTVLNADDSRFSTSDMRIDSDGNFVFEITRDETDELHIAFLIKGLKLTNFPEYLNVGVNDIHASVGGAIFGGRCMEDVWNLFTLKEPEPNEEE